MMSTTERVYTMGYADGARCGQGAASLTEVQTWQDYAKRDYEMRQRLGQMVETADLDAIIKVFGDIFGAQCVVNGSNPYQVLIESMRNVKRDYDLLRKLNKMQSNAPAKAQK